MGRSDLTCAPGAGTVFCNQYQADAWGAGEDLFTWAWRDDGTIDYAAGQLATSWDLAPDGLSVDVKIRQGVQFHKGFGTMDAEDVAEPDTVWIDRPGISHGGGIVRLPPCGSTCTRVLRFTQ